MHTELNGCGAGENECDRQTFVCGSAVAGGRETSSALTWKRDVAKMKGSMQIEDSARMLRSSAVAKSMWSASNWNEVLLCFNSEGFQFDAQKKNYVY